MPAAELGPRCRCRAQESTARLASRTNSGGIAAGSVTASPVATGMPTGASLAALPGPATPTTPASGRMPPEITPAGNASSAASSGLRRPDRGQAGPGLPAVSGAAAGIPGALLASSVLDVPPGGSVSWVPGPGSAVTSAATEPTTASDFCCASDGPLSVFRLIASSAAEVGTSAGMAPARGRLPGAGGPDRDWLDDPRAGRPPEKRRPRGRTLPPASASLPAGAALASGAGRTGPAAPASSVLNASWSTM